MAAAPTPEASPMPVPQALTLPAFDMQQQMHQLQQLQQMQQMSAMVAMAAASAGVSPGVAPPDYSGELYSVMTAPAASSAPGADMAAAMAPPMSPFDLMAAVPDPSMQAAYASMFAQFLQQLQGGACSAACDLALPPPPPSVQVQPTTMFPPTTPTLATAVAASPAAPTILVSVEGMKVQYQLTEDDLQKVFSRYGSVTRIVVDEAGTAAEISFQEFQHAQAAMADLDGKVLNGLEGTLRLTWAHQAPVAHVASAVPPTPGLPGVPPLPSWGLPGILPPTGMAATPPVPLCDVTNTFSTGAASPVCDTIGAVEAATPQRGSADPAAILGTTSDSMVTPEKEDKSAASLAHVKGVRKYTCRFLIGIENDKEFQVVRRIIGAKGANMKRIVKQTEAKLRLRGVGSGYFEGAGQKESSEPLQLCVSCTSSEGYRLAVQLVEELLEGVFADYCQFCKEAGRPQPRLQAMPHPVASGGSSGRGGSSGASPGSLAEDSDGEGESPAGKKEGRRRGRRSRAKKGDGPKSASAVERGDPPPKAPAVEEIERAIDARNEARRQCNFAEADRIRQSLHEKGVALMDEPGARGKGTEVTTWRYWRD